MRYQIPLPNLISNQLFATGSTIDLMKVDDTILDGWVVPDGIEKNLVIQTLLMTHGFAPLTHPDPEYMRKYVEIWSRNRLENWKKMYATTTLDYNPIENYDRKEDITEKRTSTNNRTLERTGTTETNSSTDTDTENNLSNSSTTITESDLKDNVSAENADDYQPASQSLGNTSVTDSLTSDQSGNSSTSITRNTDETGKEKEEESHTETFTHTNRAHGNIGVTTSQQMIQLEREIATYNVVEVMVQEYRDMFCLDIY